MSPGRRDDHSPQRQRKEERRHRRQEEENGRQRKVQARRERSSSNERMKRKPRDISDDEADVGAREPPVHRRPTKPSRRQRSMSNSDENVKFSKSRQTPDEESESGSPSPEPVRKKKKKKNGRDSSSSVERDEKRVQPASDDKSERVRKHDRKHADAGRERRRRSRSTEKIQKSRWVDDNTRHDSDRMQKQVKRERRDWSEEHEIGERVDDERRQPRARDSPEHARKHKSKHARRERRQSGDNENRRPRDRDTRRHSPHEGRRHKTHVKREHRSRSGSPSGHSRVRVKQERPSPEPRSRDFQTDEPQQKGGAGPDFKLSGNLAADTNTYKGVVIKYNQPPEARKPREKWRLYPFKGETDLPVIPLHRSSGYLIGRDRIVADIPIDHPSCSKQHAVLQFRLVDITKANGTMGRKVKPYVIDLGSTNGTYLNGKRIDAERYHELMEKDVLKFGFSSREYVLLHEKSETEEVDEEFE